MKSKMSKEINHLNPDDNMHMFMDGEMRWAKLEQQFQYADDDNNTKFECDLSKYIRKFLSEKSIWMGRGDVHDKFLVTWDLSIFDFLQQCKFID